MTRTRRRLAALLLACGGFVVSGCAAPDDISEAYAYVLIDVRTPEEFAEAHVVGALNVDWADAAEFAAWADSADPQGEYVLYCRTGRRAAEAKAYLEARGFGSVLNAGSLAQAAAALEREIATG
ncbi:MAG: rhodanese-like domain-containing protein [Promicromonosporaceae bacterium]|nr:rhodanese-like domain-containing protein [Promicromonosporaceae bacterium]